MTFYEFLDTRNNTLTRVDTLFRFWVTTTFAVIATAYIVGPDLGWVAGAGITLLYGLLTFGNILSIRLEAGIVIGVLEDFRTIANAPERADDPLGYEDMVRGIGLRPMLLGIQVAGASAALAYLFYRLSGGA